jgi:hypothetical protein
MASMATAAKEAPAQALTWGWGGMGIRGGKEKRAERRGGVRGEVRL